MGLRLRRSFVLLLGCLCLAGLVHPRQEPATCGTHSQKGTEQLQLHRKAVLQRSRSGLRALAAAPRARDIGDLALLEDSGDVVTPGLPFDLALKTVTFLPVSPNAGSYRFETGAGTYDLAAAAAGTPLEELGDDDARQIALPFSFPFYGRSYQQVFVNSDGNLTFNSPDTDISERSIGRLVTGPPRIAALFQDLDPTQSVNGVRVLSSSDRVVVSWAGVPEYTYSGSGPVNTFQVRLFPDGRIELAYAGMGTREAVVGISPGGGLGPTSGVSFSDGSAEEFSGTLAERFSSQREIDIYAAALKFYETHEDAYDYLVFFNNMFVGAGYGAVAYEVTARNINRTGYGDWPTDTGSQFGSPRQLQSVMNMGPLNQYPADPDAPIPSLVPSGDTPMTILGHEAGHLFLAFASVWDPQDPYGWPMLMPDGVHWSFNFNSDASLMEGNRFRDNGNGTFTTIATMESYSLLDRYLMGLVPAEAVPPTYVVMDTSNSPSHSPQANVTIAGRRRDIQVEEIVEAEGRRAPDYTVSQRHFRFAFILIIPEGTDPSAANLEKIETFRSRFEEYYSRYAGNLAFAETTLRRSLWLSVSPAAGVVVGNPVNATISIQNPASDPLTVTLERPEETTFTTAPSSVTIPAGATSATFQIAGLAPGVAELIARPSDPRYEAAYSRIQVAATPADVSLAVVSGDQQIAVPGAPMPEPVVLRVTDINNLPYPGLLVQASVTDGDTVSPPEAISDQNGLVSFQWTAGAGPLHKLTAVVKDAPPSSALTVTGLGEPYFELASVVNSSSYVQGLSPGGFGTIFGFNLSTGEIGVGTPPFETMLAGVQVLLNGAPVGLHYVSEQQINFVVPASTPPGTASLVVSTWIGSSSPVMVPVLAASPGIFFYPYTDLGAILRWGQEIEIYSTGLGAVDSSTRQTVLPVRVFLGPLELTPSSSGPDSYYPGLYLVRVSIPPGVSGDQMIAIEVNGVRSNEVRFRFE